MFRFFYLQSGRVLLLVRLLGLSRVSLYFQPPLKDLYNLIPALSCSLVTTWQTHRFLEPSLCNFPTFLFGVAFINLRHNLGKQSGRF